MKRRLLILGCSATKRPTPGWIPAIDRYDGPLWQTLRSADPQRTLAKTAFLSARYGFGDATTPIQDYNLRLTEDLASKMVAGGVNTRWPRPPRPRDPDTFGDSAAMAITSMSRFGDDPFDEIALVGGSLYLTVMRAFLPEFTRLRAIRPDAKVVEINNTIGLMRRELRTWLTKEQAQHVPR